MKIAILQNTLCINTAAFTDLKTAKQFLADGVWPDADEVAELPDGYGIGDTYDGAWSKKGQPEPDIEALRGEKLSEVSESCTATIHAGVDVTLPDGSTGHFSLTEEDQINLTTAYGAIQAGAEGYLYHADGELCRVYTAEEIALIATSATAHKLYHTTYCNHLNYWIKRTEDIDELVAITYGSQLPEDLAANMAAVLEAAQ